ncbi:MAG: hypothetical protein GY714_19840 [Desulfobacterales bacterium]|nr:hypothetical protein [Desulfobacterales bacterium]
MSYEYIITTKGLDLLALVQADSEKKIVFTRAEIGNGVLNGDETPEEFISLLGDIKMDAQLQREFVGDESVKIKVFYDNSSVDTGFSVHEVGLYAKDPEDDSKEILFLYCNSTEADFLPDKTTAVTVEQVINLIIKMSNTDAVTVVATSESNIIRENFGKNTILKADVEGDPVALKVEPNRLIGRKGSETDTIEDLEPDEVRDILNVPELVEGKISDEHNNVTGATRQAILALNDISFKTTNVKIADEHTYSGNGVVRELDFGMDFKTQNSVNQFGGIAFGKSVATDRDIRFSDSDMLEEAEGKTVFLSDSAKYSEIDAIRKFTEKGIEIGTDNGVNTSNEESEFFAFQTTNKVENNIVYEGVKSVVFKCHNNWDGTILGIRHIDFYNGESWHKLTPSDYTAYATSTHDAYYVPQNAFNTNLSLTGTYQSHAWLTDNGRVGDITLVIVFNTPIDITHMVINNSHHVGEHLEHGVKDLDIIFTDQILNASHVVWETDIPNGEIVWSGTLPQHSASDKADTEAILYTTPWRYNTNNGFAFHTRIGRGAAEQIKHPPEMDGMKLCFRFSKNVDGTFSWNTFTDKLLANQGLYLNLSSSPETSSEFNNDESPTSDYYSIGGHNNINEKGYTIKDYCFFGKDLSYIEPGLTGVEGATAFMKADPGQTFDCGFEPQVIIIKPIGSVANHWHVYTKEKNDFKDIVFHLSDIQKKTITEYYPVVNATKITAPNYTSMEKYLIIAFAEVVSVPAENSIINTSAKSSPGTLSEREVDMGMDLVTGENGGMILTKGGSNSWAVFDTVRGPLKRLQTDNDSAEDSDQEFIKEFTKNGVRVGNNEFVNGSSDQFYMGFQTDEKIKPPKWKAKSVIFDIAGNYGSTEYIRLRSIEFYKDGTLLPFTEADFVSKSTTSNVDYEAKNLFITGNSKIGADIKNGFRSQMSAVSSQRITVVFNSEIEFDKIVINNGHESRANTDSGAKLIDIQITNVEYDNTTYGAVVTGSVDRVFKSNILQHPETDLADDKIYVDISDEWQINRASGFGMCKVKGTGANRVFRTPYGKEVCMLWLKKTNTNVGWIVYFHANSVDSDLRLDTTQIQGPTSNFQGYKDTDVSYTKDEFYIGVHDPDEYMIYAWFGDYYMDDPTGIINTADNNRVMGVKGTTAFFTGSKDYVGTDVYKTDIDDIETVIWKRRAGGTGGWQIVNRSLNNFQDRYQLESSGTKLGLSGDPAITINGSEITMASSSYDPDHFIFMVFGRSAQKDTKEYIPWMNQTSHIGTGETDTHIDLGLDFSSDNGGMVLQKSLTDSQNWIISDTLRGIGKQLNTDTSNAESTASEMVKEFTETGVTVGTDVHINKLNSEIATFGFQTTHKTEPTRRKVKSAIFKIADTWGGSSMGIRRIEFFKGSGPVNIGESEFTAYATNEISGREAKYAFLTSSENIIGSADNSTWNTGQPSEQVLIINFNSPQDIDYIQVHNFHNTGTETNIGVKNVKVYFTDQDYTDTSYSKDVSNSELVYDGVFDQHHASNSECYTQYLYTPWHYNPQTGFGFFTHKGNGTEITTPNILGKQPTMVWTKNVSDALHWLTYCKVVGDNHYSHLDTSSVLNTTNAETFKKVNNDYIVLGVEEEVNDLNDDHITYVWTGDDMSTLGNPQEAYGIVGTSLFTEKKAVDTEIELGFKPDIIILKTTTIAGSWHLMSIKNSNNTENVFDNTLFLSSPDPLVPVSNIIWIEGTKLKFGSGTNVDCLVCAFAKDTYKPQGKSIVIHGSESNPSLFSIANGFNKYQPVDNLIGYDRNVVFSFNEGDGTYYIKLNIDGTITLKNQNCFYGRFNPNNGQDFFDTEKYKMYSPSGSVIPGIYIGKIVIQNDAILDIQKFQTGKKAFVEWFPVGLNSMYIKDNPFFTTEIDWDIWWNDVDSDENMRHVTGQYYNSGSAGQGLGAYKRQNSDELIVGSAKSCTFYSNTSGDQAASSGGYYKLIIHRKF